MLLEKISLTILLISCFIGPQETRGDNFVVGFLKRRLSPRFALVLLLTSIGYRKYYGVEAPPA
jgi:hypothetical protein